MSCESSRRTSRRSSGGRRLCCSVGTCLLRVRALLGEEERGGRRCLRRKSLPPSSLRAAERDLRAAAAADPADDEVRRLLESTRLDLDEAAKEAHAAHLAHQAAASEGDGAECDTVLSPAPLPWEQPLLRLCTAFADFSQPATQASTVSVEPAVFSAVLRLLDMDDVRVAFRMSGALGRLSAAVGATATQLRTATPPSRVLDAAAFAGACTCLAAAADNPKNRALLASSSGGVLIACLGVLSAPQGVVDGAVCSALHVVDACCRGEGISALDARAAVARHEFFSPPPAASAPGLRGGGPPGAASRSVAELLLAVARAVTESTLSDLRASGGSLESLEVCCGVIQSLAAGAGSYEPPPAEKPPAGAAAVPLADVPCAALAAWGAAGGSGGIVGALLAAAEAVLQRAGGARDAAGAALLSCGAMQRCVGALANLAQLSALRPSFVGDAAQAAAPPGGKDAAASAALPAARPRVQPLLKLLVAAATAGSVGSGGGGAAAVFETEGWLVVVGSAVAALANASLGTPAVAEYLCASGVPRCLLGLVLPPPVRNGGEVAYELPARAAALLGRLSALPAALATLREPQALRLLTGALCAAAGTVGGPPAAAGASSVPASQALLQDSLVRAVAGAASFSPASSSPTDALCAATLVASGGGLRATVAIIGSQLASLLLAPGAPGAGRFIGLGNACKLIGALLDSRAEAASPAALLAAGGVDALVGALKLEGGSGDPQASAVRRNASVALARAVRDAACMARARELRGIEILMQLQLSK